MVINKLVRAITPRLMFGFQKSFEQVFSLKSSSAIRTICLGRLKVKVTLEGQMIKCHKLSLSGLQLLHLCVDLKIILHMCSP